MRRVGRCGCTAEHLRQEGYQPIGGGCSVSGGVAMQIRRRWAAQWAGVYVDETVTARPAGGRAGWLLGRGGDQSAEDWGLSDHLHSPCPQEALPGLIWDLGQQLGDLSLESGGLEQESGRSSGFYEDPSSTGVPDSPPSTFCGDSGFSGSGSYGRLGPSEPRGIYASERPKSLGDASPSAPEAVGARAAVPRSFSAPYPTAAGSAAPRRRLLYGCAGSDSECSAGRLGPLGRRGPPGGVGGGYGESESSASEGESPAFSSASSDSDGSGGLVWPQQLVAATAASGPGGGAGGGAPAGPAKVFVKIKASHALKKKILRFRSGSLKVMTTV
ncbi:PREDICTED: dapper homolog 3 [Galeopterus variegatus]|uniref:Dapper homolog 3 n=1 Tax=Galeopterus variegatus TaxID=482537 RepID=A0ABM0R0I1_GALVR|nr:PREDICTED: dapper homolog 3 [Galeopterus variegatus]